MDDLVSRITRELPDTDRDRYDIAYQRGRAQARSALLFGGLALGAAAGAVATLLLDPARGRGRRIQLRQRAGAMARRVAATAQGRVTDLRNRVKGKATQLGLPGARSKEVADGGELQSTGRITTMDIAASAPPPAAAAATRPFERVDTDEPVQVTSGTGTGPV
jgi:gas vesicle protein